MRNRTAVLASLAFFSGIGFWTQMWAEGAEVRRGRFRIDICGFFCNVPTNDHMLQPDGIGDEVWVAISAYFAKQGKSLTLRTPTYGDFNDKAGRVGAGTLSDHGGIGRNDPIPYRPFEQPNEIPAAGWKEDSRPLLPFTLWEGELVEGDANSRVDLTAALIEDDEEGGQDWKNFLAVLNTPAAKATLKQASPQIDSGSVKVDTDLSGIGELLRSAFGQAGDRSIGNPRSISLNYTSAMQAISADPALPHYPRGSIQWEFRDRELPNPDNVGEYCLWIKVTRIN